MAIALVGDILQSQIPTGYLYKRFITHITTTTSTFLQQGSPTILGPHVSEMHHHVEIDLVTLILFAIVWNTASCKMSVQLEVVHHVRVVCSPIGNLFLSLQYEFVEDTVCHDITSSTSVNLDLNTSLCVLT